ncbi:PepSY domain-containing protein [Luteimonas sp. FCS-9]|uniref:PepSY-associated TM helix domain-containing protein n=1 Tax=Luteimonas sp. FCS-9 TaxID=1547516 RepID=UPI000A5B40E0|nr:PepSY domain-containing protein [Luteimonas sp. FCS-9]
MSAASGGGEAQRPQAARLYRAVWRWHFYAGLLVLPCLVWLAATGAAYLFPQAIDRAVHRALMVVAPSAQTVPVSRSVAAALARQPGEAFRYVAPARPDASAAVGIVAADGRRVVVYVDPHDGRVLGQLLEEGTASLTIRRLHSLEWFGRFANLAIELAAGWAILLAATGLYLWWPRGRRGGVVSVRGRPASRLFWRDLHAVSGLVFGGALAFLAATGMPWSAVWGKTVNEWANGHDFGYPAGVRVQVPMSGQRLSDTTRPAWSLEQARLPRSTDGHAGHGGGGAAGFAGQPGAIGLDAAVARFDALGLAPGYAISLPSGRDGVYTASVYPADLARQRVVHLDQYSGRVLLDMGYADYGPLGRGLEWAINVHLGQQYGLANQLVLLVACAGIVVLCASGAVAWWKRRPRGGLGVPPVPAPGTMRTVAALLAVGGLLFPLVGLSMLAVWALDAALLRRARRLRSS